MGHPPSSTALLFPKRATPRVFPGWSPPRPASAGRVLAKPTDWRSTARLAGGPWHPHHPLLPEARPAGSKEWKRPPWQDSNSQRPTAPSSVAAARALKARERNGESPQSSTDSTRTEGAPVRLPGLASQDSPARTHDSRWTCRTWSWSAFRQPKALRLSRFLRHRSGSTWHRPKGAWQPRSAEEESASIRR